MLLYNISCKNYSCSDKTVLSTGSSECAVNKQLTKAKDTLEFFVCLFFWVGWGGGGGEGRGFRGGAEEGNYNLVIPFQVSVQ